MSAQTIDGKAIAAEVRGEVAARVEALSSQGIVPGLATVLVGDDPASAVYVRAKRKACAQAGIAARDHDIEAGISEAKLLELVDGLNRDPAIHGILVQLPLPGHIDEARVVEAVRPDKDADGFHPANLGRLLSGNPLVVPATPGGIQQLLVRSDVAISGAEVVVVGRSNIVGKPLAALLMQKASGANATVTVCHTGTADIAEHTRRAEILVAAVGRAHAITGDMIARGAVVIDVGVNRTEAGLTGDVDFEAASQVAAAITPVPGGVGPMTIAQLLHNTVDLTYRSIQRPA
ncbi:MAG: bifunctional methylenetetrahydrofolate dehydrogenase/methenyltetrahydrofolate cyclohydrolase [Actinobacteria bacterium]|nr:bifunctional methylenetetrahydrofolate dehydrogenase/methenyltetrahydrofolate cyclohydrolase [Actinomycetota bacterium]MDQ3532251.1 bifunctional methylenetetrahydrofolate dehydrogenase/methenyltetrahydrofolate cyclohydrolase [Actinomycetota bacterium]